MQQPINTSQYLADESDPLLDTKSKASTISTHNGHSFGYSRLGEGDPPLVSNSPPASGSVKFGLGKASFNIITIVMGAGVLNLPKAVAETGWLGILLLILMGILSGYTSVVLSKCMYEDQKEMRGEPQYPTYTDVGERAFGVVGKWFVSLQVRDWLRFRGERC